MPILPLEPYLSPADLFSSPSDRQFLPDAERWWVLRTRPQFEKSLARCLCRDGLSFFLPLYKRSRRIQRRLVRSYLPLFPGYVFLRATDEGLQKAFETNFVVRVLRVEDQAQLSDDLLRIYDLIQSGAPLAAEERLRTGMLAEIVSGPLAGHRGTVIRRAGSKTLKLVIKIDFLQQGASVEVDSSMIRPA